MTAPIASFPWVLAAPSPTSVASIFDVGLGQGLRQFTELGVALVLSTLVGLERERRQKSAGMRTHTLVGVGSALFMLVSKYGFSDLLALHNIALDPSRVAAQIVSGIGFIGGGLIFVRRDAVRGLTTAATIWLTCGVGMACGGGLPLLAVAAVLVHFLVVVGMPWLSRRLAPDGHNAMQDVELTVRYLPASGLLGRILEVCTSRGFKVSAVQVSSPRPDDETTDEEADGDARYERDGEGATTASPHLPERPTSAARLRLQGAADPHALVGRLSELHGVFDVGARAREEEAE